MTNLADTLGGSSLELGGQSAFARPCAWHQRQASCHGGWVSWKVLAVNIPQGLRKVKKNFAGKRIDRNANQLSRVKNSDHMSMGRQFHCWPMAPAVCFVYN
ncbi:MAG: hypothetical protein WBW16_01515 [Bacteroidota bacterium]